MKKVFFKIILLFFYALEANVLADDAKVKKIFEGLEIPTHLSKNKFIAPSSIFVLEHKLGQIIEIKNYNEQPMRSSKPILNIESLISESELALLHLSIRGNFFLNVPAPASSKPKGAANADNPASIAS